MWYNNWQDMYICQDMREEPQWAEYEEIIEEEEEQGISEEDAVKQFKEKFALPSDLTEALRYIWNEAREGNMNDEEMTTGFFLLGQIKSHDNLDEADRIFWTLEELYWLNKNLINRKYEF